MTHPTKKKGKKVHTPPGASPEAKHSRGANHKNQRLNLWPAENMDLLMEEYYSELAVKNGLDKYVNKSTLAKKIQDTYYHSVDVNPTNSEGKRSLQWRARKPRVLSQGKLNKTFSLDTLYKKLSSEKLIN